MRGLLYTLLGDGPSDRLLDYPIKWALRREEVRIDKAQWADLTSLRAKPVGLAARVRAALDLYPAHLLFVHRDAEAAPLGVRREEILEAVTGISSEHVAVVPVRMTEAWFLHDEAAIRSASGNPKGTVSLRLPKPTEVEGLSDPKKTLFDQLLTASEQAGRRRQKLTRPTQLAAMRARAAELVGDYSVLLNVPAFDAFLCDLRRALAELKAHGIIR